MRTLTLLLLVFTLNASINAAGNDAPNIIFIVFDDLNTDATHDPDSFLQTPFLDRFAEESLNFTNAVANVPVCNPSRASFLSGLMPSSNGAYLNGSDAWNKEGSVLRDIASLPEHFKAQGYFTWGAGKIFHSPMSDERKDRGFDLLVRGNNGFGPYADPSRPFILKGDNRFGNVQAWVGPDEDFPDTSNANAAIEFLQQDHEKPFFMIYGLWRPHSPYTSPKRFFDAYEGQSFPVPDNYLENDLDDVPETGRAYADGLRNMRDKNGDISLERWAAYLHGYGAGTSFADWNMGRVIEALDRSEYADNTIVIVTSDNGFHLGDKNRWGKGTLWGRAAAVPFLVRGPGVKAGQSDKPAGLVDVFPTLVDAAGVAPPDHQLDGQSLVPWFDGPGQDTAGANVFAYGKHNTSVSDGDWRYIRYDDGSEELYDLARDPDEHKNLAAVEDKHEQKQRLAEHIPSAWAPSVGGRREVKRPGEPDFFANENLPAQSTDRPNFIVVLTDDQGYGDVGIYGSPGIRTPNLDRMAQEGIRFSDFYVSDPVCSASRAALLSGQRAAVTGAKGVYWPGQGGLSPEFTTIAEFLKPAGYVNALYGKWHLGDRPGDLPLAQGFDDYFGVPYSNDMYPHPDHALSSDIRFIDGYDEQRYRADLERVERQKEKMWEVAKELGYKVPLFEGGQVIEYPAQQATLTQRYFARARSFIRQHRDEPFFLLIAPSMPHVPLAASDRFRGKSERGLYGDVIEEIDWELGRLRETLQSLGLDSRTLLVFASDNGPWLEKGADGGSAGSLRGGKFSNLEGGVRVPAIVAWPGAIPANSLSGEVVGTLDLLPTIAELAGIQLQRDHHLDGQSLVTHLFEPRNRVKRGEWYYNLDGKVAGVRQGAWKYLRPGRTANWGESKTDEAQLFNLEQDPGEQNNLAASHPEKVIELETKTRVFEDTLK